MSRNVSRFLNKFKYMVFLLHDPETDLFHWLVVVEPCATCGNEFKSTYCLIMIAQKDKTRRPILDVKVNAEFCLRGLCHA